MALNGVDERRQRRRFVAIATLIVLLAFCIRATYLVSAKVEYPIRGDVNQYVLYAWNLTHRGVFSTALPDAPDAAPDSYRGPGYPLMLALTMRLAGHSELPLRPGPNGLMVLGYDTDTWMWLALAAQAILGTFTVFVTMLLARFWLSRNLTLAAGLMVALWPHLVTFTGVLLSETLFGFTVVLSLWLLFRAERKRCALTMAFAGASFGAAYLVNPVIGLFPVIIAAMLAIRGSRRFGAILLLTFMVFPVGWGLRNAGLTGSESMTGRAADTFVIGSWPQFYDAYNSRFDNEISARIMALENEEQTTFANEPMRGLTMMGERMMTDPAYYARWYLLTKPYLFWDWSIRIGWKDVYFLPTNRSPYVRIPVLSAIKQAYEWSNPLIFLLAAAAVFGVGFANIFRVRSAPFAQFSLAILLFYLTAVHVLLQAEPRYSIPYRPEEVLLALTALGWLLSKFAATRRRGPTPAKPPHPDSRSTEALSCAARMP